MPSGVAASTRSSQWSAREKDFKKYFHFDRRHSRRVTESVANDPERVRRHAFFPLLEFREEWIKFRGQGNGKRKVRKLRYAARLDAAIFARYRAILAEKYENELARLSLSDVPIAYRKIVGSTGRGKNNIDFAHEVFSFVKRTGPCFVTVLDISSYFESLDHGRIGLLWERLIGCELPPDHLAVLKAVTQYSTVNLDRLAARIGLHSQNNAGNRREKRMRQIDMLRYQRHVQLISLRDFRLKVCGGDPKLPSLLQKNRKDYGIPQGTPISDVIANFYLIDYDKVVSDWVILRGGLYRRYSDDIVLILPMVDGCAWNDARDFAQHEIKKHGPQLQIQDRKVAVGKFDTLEIGLSYQNISGQASQNGLEYLGFEYNGQKVKLKSSTISNAWRKIKRRSYGFAKRYVKRYRLRGDDWIIQNYPREWLEASIIKKVTVGQDVGVKSWTFIRYVRQASRKFSDFDADFSS